MTPTTLQNTEVEDSLTQQIVDEESNTDAPNDLFSGQLTEDDAGGEDDVHEDVQAETELLPEASDDAIAEHAADSGDSDGSGDGDRSIEDSDGEGTEEVAEEDSEATDLGESLSKLKSPKGRDYSKFSQEDAKYLKQMSNEAFEHFSKRAEENSTLQKQLDETKAVDVDHPDAYVLSDEYRDAYTNLTKAQQEQQHWRSQLIKIRNGEAWQNIEGYDDGGRMVIAKQGYKPTQQAEIDVEMAMNEAAGLNRKFSSDMDGVSGSYKKNYNEAVTLLEREQDSNFAWRTDDNVANESIVLPNAGKTTIKTLKDSFAAALPKTFRKHPMSELAANLFVTLQLQAAQTSSEKVAAKEAKRKEPKTRRKSSGASAGSEDMLEIPDWMDI